MGGRKYHQQLYRDDRNLRQSLGHGCRLHACIGSDVVKTKLKKMIMHYLGLNCVIFRRMLYLSKSEFWSGPKKVLRSRFAAKYYFASLLRSILYHLHITT